MNTLDALTLGFEIAGLAVLTISAVIAFVRWLGVVPRTFAGIDDVEERPIRIELGNRVILSIEFLIGADIVHTVQNPSIEELLGLGLIVLIRTVLHYSLQENAS